MVRVVAYFTAGDELSAIRLCRHLRNGAWEVEWTEAGSDGWMVRAVRQTAFESRMLARAAAEVLAVSSGAEFAGTDIEPG